MFFVSSEFTKGATLRYLLFLSVGSLEKYTCLIVAKVKQNSFYFRKLMQKKIIIIFITSMIIMPTAMLACGCSLYGEAVRKLG